MDITHTISGDVMRVAITGRLDGYWADHLNATLSDAVREGHHRITLDCSKVTFLSSAGIGVLVQLHKDLKGISGSFHVVRPSPPVLTILKMTRLADILIDASASAAPVVEAGPPMRRVERDGLDLDVYTLAAGAMLKCRSLGDPAPLVSGTFVPAACASLGAEPPALALGVGAFGHTFEECRTRFGELLSVNGTMVYQPADGTNVADYLIGAGPLGTDVSLLYGLACDGRFSHLVHFEASQPEKPVALTTLLGSALDETAAESLAFVMVAETSGLVGAALRRSPAGSIEDHDLFAFPAVRSRLSFTTERAFPWTVALVGGVVTRASAGAGHPQLRPIGEGFFGHLHAAAFRFHPVRKGFVELTPTVNALFDGHRLLGVLHLLYDDRPGGAGDSSFIRGACWLGPIAGGWLDRQP